MAFTFDQIFSDLRKKIFYPVYLLTGDEPYFIDEISNYIENNILDDTEKEFNQTITYGADTDIQTLVSAARRFTMFANYQVIIVREAQEIRNIDGLEEYVKNPQPSTILVLCYKYKKIDKRKSFAKTVDKKGVFFEGKKLYDNQIPDWIQGTLKSKGYGITPKAAILLADYVGSDLGRIMQETGKLFINVPAGTVINEDHIEENIGISKDFNIFELQKALGEKNILRSNQIAKAMSENPKENPMVVIITILFGFFSKILIYQYLKDKSRNNIASALGINPYFIPDYQKAAGNYTPSKLSQVISILREFDLRSKGIESVSVSEADLPDIALIECYLFWLF